MKGPWSGGVTASGFIAGYTLAGVGSARLVVSRSPDLGSPVHSPSVSPDADGAVLLSVDCLQAGSRYHFGVEADGRLLSAGRGEVRTFPVQGRPASFSVAFGSCQKTVPTDVTYAAILARSGPTGRALQIIHMGDLNYRDWSAGTTAAQVFGQHMVSLGSASMAPTLARIPFEYTWDNHDWGGDTSDRTAPAGDVVAAVYRRVFPTYPLPAGDGRGAYRSWVIGRVRFVQIDTRSYRDPQSCPAGPAKTMLGVEQKAWLKAQLLEPEPVKVLCGNYPWRAGSASGGRWGSYVHEFEELNVSVADMVGHLYVIFGDRHHLAADSGVSKSGRGVPQAGGSPFQRGTTSPGESWSQGTYGPSSTTVQAYGWLDVTDSGDDITISYEGVTSVDGTTRVAMKTVFATDG
jgi:hypothetical protein